MIKKDSVRYVTMLLSLFSIDLYSQITILHPNLLKLTQVIYNNVSKFSYLHAMHLLTKK